MLGDQSAIEASEKAKKQRALRKAGKEIQQGVLLKRQREKSDAMQKIARHRKGLKNQMAGADDFDVVAEQESHERYKRGGMKSAKRQAKDAKFSRFGGKGKFSKSNTRVGPAVIVPRGLAMLRPATSSGFNHLRVFSWSSPLGVRVWRPCRIPPRTTERSTPRPTSGRSKAWPRSRSESGARHRERGSDLGGLQSDRARRGEPRTRNAE